MNWNFFERSVNWKLLTGFFVLILLTMTSVAFIQLPDAPYYKEHPAGFWDGFSHSAIAPVVAPFYWWNGKFQVSPEKTTKGYLPGVKWGSGCFYTIIGIACLIVMIGAAAAEEWAVLLAMFLAPSSAFLVMLMISLLGYVVIAISTWLKWLFV